MSKAAEKDFDYPKKRFAVIIEGEEFLVDDMPRTPELSGYETYIREDTHQEEIDKYRKAMCVYAREFMDIEFNNDQEAIDLFFKAAEMYG